MKMELGLGIDVRLSVFSLFLSLSRFFPLHAIELNSTTLTFYNSIYTYDSHLDICMLTTVLSIYYGARLMSSRVF